MKLQRFNQFIAENLRHNREDLKKMMSLGILDEPSYKSQIRQADRDDYLSANKQEADNLNSVLALPGAKKLLAQGLHLVSSKTQIKHGNYIFSLDPNYVPHNGWGIGFFTAINTIRRMTPKGVENLVWRRERGSMDIIIKRYPGTMQPMEFLDTAMSWAADNIDFEDAKQKSGETEWKYYTKKSLRNGE